MTRRAVRRSALALAALALAVFVAAAWQVVQIRADLEAGRDRLESLELEVIRARGGVGPVIDEAVADIERADRRARDSLAMRALAPLPVVGSQVAGLRELTGATTELAEVARTAGERIDAGIDRAGESGRARVALLDTVLDELDTATQAIEAIDTGSAPLLGPGATARDRLEAALAEAPDRLGRLEEEVEAIRALLDGPSTYLAVVGNNAEMRAGAGMPLQAGLLTFDGGEFEVGEFKSTVSELFVPEPTGDANANPPEQLLDTYPRWNLGRDFPETAVTPNFPVTAPIYADLAFDAQGWDVDGVIQLDAVALLDLLEVVGPVSFGGDTYTADNAAEKVLRDAYLEFDTLEERETRLAAQSDLAAALFESLDDADVDPLALVEALQRAADGRHVMAWSPDPVLERVFTSFRASGVLPPNTMLVSVQNTAANKLDFFIDPTVDLRIDDAPDRRRVTATVTVPNPVPDQTSPYIDGFVVEPPGTHRVYLSFHLPAQATSLELQGFTPTEQGWDGPARVIGTRFTIPRGSTQEVVLHFDLPTSTGAFGVLPSGRLRPVGWTVDGSATAPLATDDATAFAVFLRPVGDGDGRSRPVAAFGLVVAVAGAALALRASTRAAGAAPPAPRRVRNDLVTAGVLLAVAAISVVVWLLSG